MGSALRMTTALVRVLAAMLDDPAEPRYGLDLIRDTGLPSGTLYPILVRLEKFGWVRAQWEDIDPVAEGRPARRYYRLTAEGVRDARLELAELYRHLSKKDGARDAAARKPRTA